MGWLDDADEEIRRRASEAQREPEYLKYARKVAPIIIRNLKDLGDKTWRNNYECKEKSSNYPFRTIIGTINSFRPPSNYRDDSNDYEYGKQYIWWVKGVGNGRDERTGLYVYIVSLVCDFDDNPYFFTIGYIFDGTTWWKGLEPNNMPNVIYCKDFNENNLRNYLKKLYIDGPQSKWQAGYSWL